MPTSSVALATWASTSFGAIEIARSWASSACLRWPRAWAILPSWCQAMALSGASWVAFNATASAFWASPKRSSTGASATRGSAERGSAARACSKLAEAADRLPIMAWAEPRRVSRSDARAGGMPLASTWSSSLAGSPSLRYTRPSRGSTSDFATPWRIASWSATSAACSWPTSNSTRPSSRCAASMCLSSCSAFLSCRAAPGRSRRS